VQLFLGSRKLNTLPLRPAPQFEGENKGREENQVMIKVITSQDKDIINFGKINREIHIH
jgi:hypothetical protein